MVARGAGVDPSRRFAGAATRWVPELEVVGARDEVPVADPAGCLSQRSRAFLASRHHFNQDHGRGRLPQPHYHGPTDTLDTLDYRFMANVTRALVATLAEHAGVS